ncbi:MAG: hypothetical protein K6A98_08110 [Prevotella sp.]|nr:hypothetical protein [Prevotella sp.]
MTTKLDIIRLKILAAMGNVNAMCMLGNNYLYGIGVEVDLEKSHSYLYKAAQKGHPAAKSILDSFADEGRSTSLEPDFARFYEIIRTICREADRGDPQALYARSVLLLKNENNRYMLKRAIKDMTIACKQGYVPALKALMDYNPRKAYPIIKRLAEADNPNAEVLYMLSRYYLKGEVVCHDVRRYFDCLYKAAMHGYEDAYNELADCYLYGLGTVQSDSLAFEWYKKAVPKSLEATYNLGNCYTYAIGTEKDEKKAFECYKIAALQGEPESLYHLAMCYNEGLGVEVNEHLAMFYLNEAAIRGSKRAVEMINNRKNNILI